MNRLHQFNGHISLACDQYVQYLLVGTNPRSLTDTDGGYNLKGLSFAQNSTRPSQPRVIRFPLRALSSLKLNNINMKSPK
jgi:hypothetical protein